MTDIRTMTQIEQSYVAQGYKLPEGYTWEYVATQRTEFSIDAIYVPVATGRDVCAWGVPMKDGKFLSRNLSRPNMEG